MRYVGDQARVGFFHESGTYANPTGTTLQWLGWVTEHSIDESTNVINVRYAGTASRNIGSQINGPLDYAGTLTFHPQDWRMLPFALGSNVDGGSPSPYTHTISETNSNNGNYATSGTTNPFLSFTIVDQTNAAVAGEHFGRRIQGCTINTLTLEGTEGEILTVTADYMAQSGTFISGAAPTLQTPPSDRPYVWHDVLVHIPSGTVYNETKAFTWSLNNNLELRHYLNGSRIASNPIPTMRDYEFSLTIDGTSERTATLYNQYFLGGSTFNTLLAISARTGSQELFITMSGCKLLDMEAPTIMEGVHEQTLTIRPEICTVLVNDTTELYNGF